MKSLKQPYCDCRELNLIRDTVPTIDATPGDPDASYSMHLTELNRKQNCKHCNYVPIYLNSEEFRALYRRDSDQNEPVKKI